MGPRKHEFWTQHGCCALKTSDLTHEAFRERRSYGARLSKCIGSLLSISLKVQLGWKKAIPTLPSRSWWQRHVEEVLNRFLVTGSSSLSKISSSRKYPSYWFKDHKNEALKNLMPRTNPQERLPNSCHFKLLLDTTFSLEDYGASKRVVANSSGSSSRSLHARSELLHNLPSLLSIVTFLQNVVDQFFFLDSTIKGVMPTVSTCCALEIEYRTVSFWNGVRAKGHKFSSTIISLTHALVCAIMILSSSRLHSSLHENIKRY